MSRFILVHGSWHGAWCWYKILPRLRELGHDAVAVDLPGHGRDRTPLDGISLDDCAGRVIEAIEAGPEPVVLVAHSRNGIVGSRTAELCPDGIRTVVYLAAFLLDAGERIIDVAPTDPDSLIGPNLEFDPDGHWDMLKAEAFRPALYADCPDEDVALAHALLTPEPFAPSMVPMETTAERFGTVPRVYVECLQDRAVTLDPQRRMCSKVGVDRVLSIDTDHSPYFSRPDELASHLDAVARDESLARPTALA